MATMNHLQEELEHLKTEIFSSKPTAIVERQGALMRLLLDMGIGKEALGVGDTIPAFELPDQTGATVRSGDVLKTGAMVLSFFRGQWCPFCAAELKALHLALPEITARGGRLITVSPQTLDQTMTTVERLLLDYAVLADEGNLVAQRFGLAFQIPEEYREFHDEHSARISEYNGDLSYMLPIPATYVIDSGGVIRYAYVNPDYTRRAEPTDVLTALESL